MPNLLHKSKGKSAYNSTGVNLMQQLSVQCTLLGVKILYR